MIIILGLSTLFCLPYMLVFAQGNEAQTATGLDAMLGSFSLGNIGQSKDMCSMQDINNCDTIDLKCPAHTEIRQLRQFGIEDKKNTSKCGGSVANSTSIELNLIKNEHCSLPMYLDKKNYNDFQTKIVK